MVKFLRLRPKGFLVPYGSLAAVEIVGQKCPLCPGAIIVLTAASTPTQAYKMVQRYGPVGLNDTILATFGNKQVIAFYELDEGRCAVSAVVFEKTDAETGVTTAARVRVSLSPRQMVHLDSSDNQTLNLQCGDYAKTLAVVW
jgi:hypothetical protein